MENLLASISQNLFETFSPVKVMLPYSQSALIALMHEQGQVESEEHVQGGVILQGRVPGRLLARYIPWEAKLTKPAE
jgi:GTP-binding protein HflX